MIASIDDALAKLNLQPGQTYRTRVNGRELEVRALPAAAESEPEKEEASTIGEPMLLPWFEFPPAANDREAAAEQIQWPPSDPPVVPPEDEDIG